MGLVQRRRVCGSSRARAPTEILNIYQIIYTYTYTHPHIYNGIIAVLAPPEIFQIRRLCVT